MNKFVLFSLFSFLLSVSSIDLPAPGAIMQWHFTSVWGWQPFSREYGNYFMRKNGDIILWGGYTEQLVVNQGPNIFYNDMYAFKPSNATWTQLNNGQGVAPSGRVTACGGYNAEEDAFYLFGGGNFSNTFTYIVFLDDTWKYSFATNTWHQLTPTGARQPGPRAGQSCLSLGTSFYMFGGSLPPNPDIIDSDELWRFEMSGEGEWFFIGNGSTRATWPINRDVAFFDALTNNVLALSIGETHLPLAPGSHDILTTVQQDFWLYYIDSNTWVELADTNKPDGPREFQAITALSTRWIMYQNGDNNVLHNLTASETCLPPLLCFIESNVTDETFFYDTFLQRWSQFEPVLKPPKTRKSMVIRDPVSNTLYMFGGHGFDGIHPIGMERDMHMWHFQPDLVHLENNPLIH